MNDFVVDPEGNNPCKGIARDGMADVAHADQMAAAGREDNGGRQREIPHDPLWLPGNISDEVTPPQGLRL